MTSFGTGDIVWVPVPYVEREAFKSRPAVILSRRALGPSGTLRWAAMITTAGRAPWPGDIAITDLASAGLPASSVVRIEKIATLETAVAERIGSLGDADSARLQHWLAGVFDR